MCVRVCIRVSMKNFAVSERMLSRCSTASPSRTGRTRSSGSTTSGPTRTPSAPPGSTPSARPGEARPVAPTQRACVAVVSEQFRGKTHHSSGMGRHGCETVALCPGMVWFGWEGSGWNRKKKVVVVIFVERAEEQVSTVRYVFKH